MFSRNVPGIICGLAHSFIPLTPHPVLISFPTLTVLPWKDIIDSSSRLIFPPPFPPVKRGE